MEIQAYLDSLSNDDLCAKVREARIDVTKAAEDQPNSEWHESCFAGLLLLAKEANSRGLTV